MDYTEEDLQSLFEQFEDLIILDIWSREGLAPDRKGRRWVKAMVQKK